MWKYSLPLCWLAKASIYGIKNHEGPLLDLNSDQNSDYVDTTNRKICIEDEKDLPKMKVTKKKTMSITPTSEQLASLNLKEGRNSVVFTFSTPMLGKQQVIFYSFVYEIYLIASLSLVCVAYVCLYVQSAYPTVDLGLAVFFSTIMYLFLVVCMCICLHVYLSTTHDIQVDAKIYLWKWDTRVVISDVDGTITR